jgi:hypothetical protein
VTSTTATATATTDGHAIPRATPLAAAVALALGAPADAQEWLVEPKVALAAIYSDNVQLARSGLEESELVTQIAPSLAINHVDERLELSLNYGFEYLSYAEESDRNESFNEADAHILAELLKERFFVSLDGGISQQVIDPEQAFPPSNIPLSFNRTDAIDAAVAPWWRQPLGPVGDLLLRYEQGLVDYDEESLHDLERSHATVTLDSPAHRRGVTWRFNYDFDTQSFDPAVVEGVLRTPADAEFEEASAQLGYWVTGSVHVFALGGAESDFQAHRDEAELDESFWEAGLNYTVAERDDFLIRYGERVFGSTLNLRWLHQFRDMSLTLEYYEQPSTNAETRFDRRAQPIFDSEVGLDRPSDADIFVRQRLQSALVLDHGRSQWTWTLYGERRTDRTPADPDDDPLGRQGEEQTRGSSIDWLWRAGAHTDLGFGVDWERSEFTDGRDFDLLHARAEARYALGDKTALRLKIERAGRSGDRDTSTGTGDVANYDENRVSLFIERSFF